MSSNTTMPALRALADEWESFEWQHPAATEYDKGYARGYENALKRAELNLREVMTPPVENAEEGPGCDLCGKTSCPDADQPEFSEPRECVLTPVYNELRYDRCDYGCGRDITKATIRRAARLMAGVTDD